MPAWRVSKGKTAICGRWPRTQRAMTQISPFQRNRTYGKRRQAPNRRMPSVFSPEGTHPPMDRMTRSDGFSERRSRYQADCSRSGFCCLLACFVIIHAIPTRTRAQMMQPTRPETVVPRKPPSYSASVACSAAPSAGCAAASSAGFSSSSPLKS